jgi:hypothetical protein
MNRFKAWLYYHHSPRWLIEFLIILGPSALAIISVLLILQFYVSGGAR